MHFHQDFPDKLRSSILISEVIGKRVKLKFRGKEFSGLCPFHNEKSPSFSVNDQKGFYYCFGCAAHGDIIGFTMKIDGLEFRDAVQKLADDFGIAIPQIKFDQAQEKLEERNYLILEKSCQFFEKNLHEASNSEARNYLKKRRLNSTIAKKFRLGFAPNSFEALTNFLKSEGFSDLEISRTGIIGKNDRQNFYDKFRNRVIFPITDKKNRIIAFGGRSLGDEMPKYLNSSETEIFKKNQTLYNFFLARKAIFTKGFAVVVEGYMDAIALFANGIENVVAGLGTALGAEHLRELFYITDKIIICLDGDSAGISAAKRVSEIALPLISAKKNIAFTILPNQLDPDDFVQKFGAHQLEKTFEQAAPLSQSLFEFALMELKIDKTKKISAENKAKIEGNLASKIAVISDAASKKYFSLFFKDLLFLLGKKSAKNFDSFSNKIYAKPSANSSDFWAKNIIAYLIKFPELAKFRDGDFDIKELQFGNENLTHLKEIIIELIESGKKNLPESLENSDFSKDMTEVKNIVVRLNLANLNLDPSRFRLLLLKDLLLQVDQQYKDSLSQIDEIDTHQTAITNQKIKEIFDYKNSLEQQILALEKEVI